MKEIKKKILSLLDENKSQINIAIKDDGREFEFDNKKLEQILDGIINKKYKVEKQNKIVFTNGNPYTTIYVLFKAIQEDDKLILCTRGKLSNLNKQLVRIFNQLCSKKLLNYKSDIKIRDLYLTLEKKNNIIVEVFDDIETNIELQKFGFDVNYNSMFTIDIYYDSDEYEEMVEIVEDYATSKYMNTNVYLNKSYEEIVLRTGSELSSLSLLVLTKDYNKFEKLKEKFPEKNVYINYNPFDDYEDNVIKKIVNL